MSPDADLEERLAFLGLGEADVERLRALRPLIEERAAEFVAAFYRHLLGFPATRQLLRDAEVKQRLVGEQREYLLSLTEPRFDEAFTASRRRIGEIHNRIGLEPRWYLGAYAQYLTQLVPLVFEAHRDDAQAAAEVLLALQKLIFLDAQIAMETYIQRRQSELEYQTEELASEGRQLARELQDQQAALRRTEGRARAAEELASVATLVAGLAHEIGTPMGVIQGHARLLESAVSGEDAQWRLRTIREQIERISRLIQTLLNIARPGRSRRTPVALGTLLDTTLAFLGERLARRGVALRTSLASVPNVIGDPERLQQLFLNLLFNAIDAMPQGGELKVELRPAADAGELEVCIADTGMGIPEASLERIFEAFYTTKAAGEGSGLGLVVATGIAADHGGRIEVASREGEGSEFRVILPLAAPGVSEAA